jgi:hypothetical protein
MYIEISLTEGTYILNYATPNEFQLPGEVGFQLHAVSEYTSNIQIVTSERKLSASMILLLPPSDGLLLMPMIQRYSFRSETNSHVLHWRRIENCRNASHACRIDPTRLEIRYALKRTDGFTPD